MTAHDTRQHGARALLATAAFVLAFFVPSIALAANTASFSTATPKSGSISSVAKQAISVIVVDKYGVKGTSGYSMTLDGTAVKPTCTYYKGYGYTKFRLAYTAAGLASAKHTVAIKIVDLKKKTSTYSWSFTVDTAGPVTTVSGLPAYDMDTAKIVLTATDSAGVAATYYRIDGGPQTLYLMAIPGPDGGTFPAGPHTIEFWSVDRLGNTETHHLVSFTVRVIHTLPTSAADASCIAAGCHAATDITVIHQRTCADCHSGAVTLSDDCVSCHTATPPLHVVHVAIVSANTTGPADCTASTCHGGTGVTILTLHGGNCALCHDSPDATVLQAVAAGGATCESCHGYIAPHTSTTQHVATLAPCVGAGCHASDVTLIHVRPDGTQACVACHNPLTQPSTTCTQCHSANTTIDHAPGATFHVVSAGGCVGTDCHTTDVSVLHSTQPTGSAAPAAPGCAACHGRTDGVSASTDCTVCHGSDVTAAHSAGNAYHTSTTSTCVKDGCHASLVTRIHANAPHHCASCHATGVTPSTDCTTCHSSTPSVDHAAAASLHLAPASTCVTDGCHPADVTQIHASVDTTVDGVHLTGCQVCHDIDSTQTVPLTLDCSTCHGTDVASIHQNADVAHTASNSCISANCHDANVSVIHENAPNGCQTCHASGSTPTTDCSTCHGSDLETIHQSAEGSHTVAASGCNTPGCHNTDVSVIHTTQAIGGPAAPGCVVCHGTDSGEHPSTNCSDCHPAVSGDAHIAGNTPHTVSGTCVSSQCHLPNLSAIHNVQLPDSTIPKPGCNACHGTGITPEQDCNTPGCHPSTDIVILHSSADRFHDASVSASGCVGSGCHPSNVSQIHTAAPNGCLTCHADGQTPTLDCSTCHGSDITTIHASADASHATDPSCVGDGCHDANVSVVHSASNGGPGCICHQPGYTLTTSCFTVGCHSGDITTVHAAAASSHTSALGGCTSPGCHNVDVSVIHTTQALGADAPAAPGCVVCHGSAAGEVTTTTCSVCHPASSSDAHAPGNVPHTITATDTTCVSDQCHYNSLSRIHNTQLPGSTIPKPGCVACHGSGITPSQTCTDCHTEDLPTLHASADASHTATNGCVGVGCHPSNVSQIHVDAPDGCFTCHSDETSPTLDCTNAACHGSDVSAIHASADTSHTSSDQSCVGGACHQTNVMDIHSAPGGPGCVVCHGTGAGQHTSTNCTDVGCHSSDYASLHQNGDQAHFAPASTCITTGCHNGGNNVAAIHGSGPSCAACHAPGVTPSLDCSTCHPATELASDHASQDASHSSSTTSCVGTGCHDTNVASIHATSSAAIQAPGCAACHLDATDTTPSPTPSTDCSTCHSTHVSVVHQAGNAYHTVANGSPDATDGIVCVTSGCHTNDITTIHATAMPGHTDTPPGCAACHSTGEMPSNDCTDCHSSDPRTVHAAGTASHTVDVPGCTETGCHPNSLTSIHTAPYPDNSPGPECTPCHSAGATPAQGCTTPGCHDGDLVSVHASVITSMDAVHSTEDTLCTTPGCHSTNVATVHMTSPGSGVAPIGCVACHGNPLNAPSTECTDCHGSDVSALHPNADSDHIVVTSCNAPGCHDHDVRVIHASAEATIDGVVVSGCGVCHDNPSQAATTDCTVCHGGTSAGDHSSSHQVCNDCHLNLYHEDGPVVGSTSNTGYYAYVNNCDLCHQTGQTTYTHPEEGCHGCDDPNSPQLSWPLPW